jgi:mono/diheme cytochrome c family protein
MMSEKPLTSLRWLSIVALATIAGIGAALSAVANAAETDAAAGQQLFQEKCVACHTVGKGALVGPDLKGVTERRPREWLEQWIAAPDAMLAKKDPVATDLLHQFRDLPMPNQGLKTPEVTAILAYLETAGSAGAAEPATSAPAVQGNPEIGKDLFTGVVRFQNGGPPCMACHSVGGIGALGGGNLGPDLTGAGARYGGAAGLDAFVAGTPTPTMKAVWSQHPLTTEERASVVAFVGQAGVSERPAEAIWQLAGLAALGLVVLLAVAGLRWRNRLRNGVWRPMVAVPTTGPGAFHRTIADEERGQHTGPYHGGWFPGTFHPGWMARFSRSGSDEPRANVPRRFR